MSNRIGVGIVTYNRPDFFEKCLASIDRSAIDELVVVNDGTPYTFNDSTILIQHETNKGVGISKNDAFKRLLDAKCNHIFIIEDDIIVKNNQVFQAYIQAGQASGLKHMMYGYHGPANKRNGVPAPRYVIDYGKDLKIALNQHCVGAFCYYTRDVLETVGLNDEAFVNAWEHVEHSYRIVKAGYLPAYWWWPDLANSNDYLDELACSEVSSTIRPQTTWKENIIKGAKHFIGKHGLSPVEIPNATTEDVVAKLKNIYKQHANR